MKDGRENPAEGGDPVAAAAAEWTMRLDRGLSPAEQDEYLQWLAADPRHGEALRRQRRTWEAFDRLAGLQTSVEAVPDPELLNPARSAGTRAGAARVGGRVARADERGAGAGGGRVRTAGRGRVLAWGGLLAAAAACAVVAFRPQPDGLPAGVGVPGSAVVAGLRLEPIEERTLDDGTRLRLNRTAAVAVEFTPAERRVRLERGEAAFAVAKDPARPFVVVVAGVSVRAVGTEFNVRHDGVAVDVIVTEGRVAVSRLDRPEPAEAEPLVAAGQRAVVALDAAGTAPRIETPPAEEVARRLAWQPRPLTFSDEPLPVILNEFNRHNPVTLRLDDPGLAELRLSARFRSDNVPGFLRLLEAEFGVLAHVQPGGEIALRRGR